MSTLNQLRIELEGARQSRTLDRELGYIILRHPEILGGIDTETAKRHAVALSLKASKYIEILKYARLGELVRERNQGITFN